VSTGVDGVDTHAMASRSPKDQPATGYPEFAVRREGFNQFFDPPLARSTFHDFVNKGTILPVKGIRGFYRLNESLRRLGLREVPSLPESASKHSTEDIIRLAFTTIDPIAFPAPSWLLTVEALDSKDLDHARLYAEQHQEHIDALGSIQEKLAYLSGVLDAVVMREAENSSGNDPG